MSKYLAFLFPGTIFYVTFYLWPGDYTFVYATAAFIFIVIPLIDSLLSGASYAARMPVQVRSEFNETVIILLSLPLQTLNIFFFAWFIATHNLATHELVMMVFIAGILSALYAQNPAHELIHHGTRFEQAIGAILFSTCFYSGAKLAHVHSHHVLVASKHDPTSAQYGMSLYEFLPGAIAVNLFGWRGKNSFLSGNSTSQNWKIILDKLFGYALSVGWAVSVFAFFGTKSLVFFFAQAFMGILILEMMNYVGHYGLERKINEDGTLEPISEKHSWDCDMPFSNLVLINVQKHADHHLNPNKTYGALICTDNSPRLPFSYPLLFILTLFPFLWRRIINPRIDKYRTQCQPQTN